MPGPRFASVHLGGRSVGAGVTFFFWAAVVVVLWVVHAILATHLADGRRIGGGAGACPGYCWAGSGW